MHISLNHSDETTIVVSQYFSGGAEVVDSPYQDEIFQVWTDGSSLSKVRRLAHHRSIDNGNYWAQPHAASSLDGRFIMYASNWGGSEYIDVFIIIVPTLDQDTEAPGVPTGVQVIVQ
jgi:hypothetical protein